ncbi:MAG TPA: AmmeMemoRadiSam system protein A [Halanaerobiales bacterium]|nr:AmmeMemoRadiSam system protein A [Halanaerobiales bacterium]
MEEEMGYVELARKTIENYIKEKRKIDPPQSGKFQKRAGAFVSIKKSGQLRGCIGTIEPTRPFLGQEIVENAISASTRDPRFQPITEDELNQIDISVDILGEKEPVEDISQLDPEEYGVIVKKNSRTGLLLPNLEGVDTVERQLEIARKKAGISAQEDYQVLRFKVERYEE